MADDHNVARANRPIRLTFLHASLLGTNPERVVVCGVTLIQINRKFFALGFLQNAILNLFCAA